MNNTYSITRDKAVEVLDDVDKFMTNFTKFNEKFPQYSYTVDIFKEGSKWLANVNIKKDETDKIKTT